MSSNNNFVQTPPKMCANSLNLIFYHTTWVTASSLMIVQLSFIVHLLFLTMISGVSPNNNWVERSRKWRLMLSFYNLPFYTTPIFLKSVSIAIVSFWWHRVNSGNRLEFFLPSSDTEIAELVHPGIGESALSHSYSPQILKKNWGEMQPPPFEQLHQHCSIGLAYSLATIRRDDDRYQLASAWRLARRESGSLGHFTQIILSRQYNFYQAANLFGDLYGISCGIW